MMTDLQDIFELSKEALSLQSLDLPEDCSLKLDIIREKLMNVDRGKLDTNVIWNISGLIKTEISKWTEDSKPRDSSLEVCAQALFCLRNTFVNCSQIQLMVAETDDLREVVLTCVKWVFTSNGKRNNDRTVGHDNDDHLESSEWETKLSQFARASVTCLGNLVAANSSTRKILWPYLLPLVRPMLTYSETAVSYLSSMVIFNCLLEPELRKDLCSCGNIDEIVCDLLTLYLDGMSSSNKTLCFVLYVLEMAICCDGRLSSVWPSLSGPQQLLLLDVISNIEEGKSGSKCGSISSSAITYLISFFKTEADKILRTHTCEIKDDTSLVIPRLLSYLCLLASSEHWGPTLKEDSSLLITTVSLLQCMNNVGNVKGNEFSRMSIDELSNEERLGKAESHPAYGFKRDLIRLIAGLVYRHKVNQDQVREMGGVTLILESSQFDAKNPGIKEASIYAIRNLLEGNLDNANIIKDLKYQGSAENQAMHLRQENGMVVVQGPSLSSLDEEDH